MEIRVPPNTHPITEMYVFLSIDDKGNEGICSHVSRVTMQNFQMVTSEKALVDSLLKPIIKEMAKLTRTKIRLVKFTGKQVLEEFNP